MQLFRKGVLPHIFHTAAVGALAIASLTSGFDSIKDSFSPNFDLPAATAAFKAPSTQDYLRKGFEMHDSIELVSLYMKALHDDRRKYQDQEVIKIPNSGVYVIDHRPVAGQKFEPVTLIVPTLHPKGVKHG